MTQQSNYVFLHGGGQGSWIWGECIHALRQQSNKNIGVISALDVPGCGSKREHNTDGVTVNDIVQELTEEIESLGVGNIVLVGHSQAGTLLSSIVSKHPDIFERIVFVSCSAPESGQTVPEMMGSNLRGANENEVGWPLDPATATPTDQQAMMFCNDMDDVQRKGFLSKLGKDMWPQLSYTETFWNYGGLNKVNSTYVICERDESLPVAWQKTFARRLFAKKLIGINAGHQVMNTQPEALVKILIDDSNY